MDTTILISKWIQTCSDDKGIIPCSILRIVNLINSGLPTLKSNMADEPTECKLLPSLQRDDVIALTKILGRKMLSEAVALLLCGFQKCVIVLLATEGQVDVSLISVFQSFKCSVVHSDTSIIIFTERIGILLNPIDYDRVNCRHISLSYKH